MAGLTTVQAATADGSVIDHQEWVLVGLAAIMAFNVWATANLPQYTHLKTYVAALIVVMGALHTALVGGISTPEIMNMAILALSALGVVITRQPITTVVNGVTVPSNGEVRGTNPIIA